MTGSNPPRVPVPTQSHLVPADVAGQFGSLRGRRCVLSNADGAHREWRVWSEALEVREDGPWVMVTRERHWWAWELLGVAPRLRRWPAGAVWVEEVGA